MHAVTGSPTRNAQQSKFKKKYRTIINNGSTVCHRTASYQWKIKELLTYLLTYLLNIIIIYNIQDNVYGAVIMAEPPGSPGSFDECRTAPSGRRPKTKPDDLVCESACTGCQNLHPPSPFIVITQSESWYSCTVPQRVEGWVDLAGWLHTEMVYSSTDGHPSWY